jgi:hypothetical protein
VWVGERGPNGYATDMWTLARVGEVIEAETGVVYHQSHVWRILRQMGWSRQRPDAEHGSRSFVHGRPAVCLDRARGIHYVGPGMPTSL